MTPIPCGTNPTPRDRGTTTAVSLSGPRPARGPLLPGPGCPSREALAPDRRDPIDQVRGAGVVGGSSDVLDRVAHARRGFDMNGENTVRAGRGLADRPRIDRGSYGNLDLAHFEPVLRRHLHQPDA